MLSYKCWLAYIGGHNSSNINQQSSKGSNNLWFVLAEHLQTTRTKTSQVEIYRTIIELNKQECQAIFKLIACDIDMLHGMLI